MEIKHWKNELGFAARRNGRFLEVKINVTLDTMEALKTFKAVYEMEKCLYESRIKTKKGEA